MDLVLIILLSVIGTFVVTGGISFLLGFFYFKKVKKNQEDYEKEAAAIIEKANTSAENILLNAKKEAKEEAEEVKTSILSSIEEKKKEIKDQEGKVAVKQEMLEKKEYSLDKREESVISRENLLEERRAFFEQKTAELEKKNLEIEEKKNALQEKMNNVISYLEKAAHMSEDEAKDELMKKIEEKEVKKIALYKEQMHEQAEAEVEERAKALLCLSLDKYAQDVTNEHSTSTIALPNDEMKGRIIGREGRNIKSMEQLFGVSLIIDDTPETITVSCFDPIRREKAKLTLEALIKDGRIQPGRIEDLYYKIAADFDESLKRIGEQTIFKLGLPRISANLLVYIGRLKYRTSYGQNVLDHSIQVAYLSSVMASELGLDPILAKRAGLLHDIGKSIDCEMEGSHVQLGRDLAKKFGEPEVVINAIESHHGDVPKKFLISDIVSAADTLSAARPGARSETLETYIKRLEAIEEICNSYDGVSSSYALQSGRDVRVMVVPEKVSDEDAKVIASLIKGRIEDEVSIPGQIKISVIREMRAVEFAKK
ncbi:MAG: ribonuclease Y [Candidatus Enterosoma sp.]|nr:ribonuclease Y [Bacilli bacterium]MDD7607452.1 ribonuclease Y [bacterium]MDY3907077.1 ribonuclease Y [Candidatus Enterosoma sp.]MDY5866421.1 ribonuclease Y [Candidatus Enterosoma sp.]